jgi:hypothetical protein
MKKSDRILLPAGYAEALADLKGGIARERLRVVMSANSAMVLLYWEKGRVILQRQTVDGRGSKVVDRLAADLKAAFPDIKGLSPRNLKYMRAFAEAWPNRIFFREPGGRGAAWRSEDGGDSRIPQFARHQAEPGKIVLPLPGFHPAPGEFPDPRRIKSGLLHQRESVIHLIEGPVLRIIRSAKIGR